MAWLVDLGGDDIRALQDCGRPVSQTVFAALPSEAGKWAEPRPMWLERFRRCTGEYVGRLDKPGPIDPLSLGEEVALHMAFAAARAAADPDELLSPDVAEALPSLPADYDWTKAEDAVGWSDGLRRIYGDDPPTQLAPDDPLHPESWFEVG